MENKFLHLILISLLPGNYARTCTKRANKNPKVETHFQKSHSGPCGYDVGVLPQHSEGARAI